jgi:hypothetical protein
MVLDSTRLCKVSPTPLDAAAWLPLRAVNPCLCDMSQSRAPIKNVGDTRALGNGTFPAHMVSAVGVGSAHQARQC